jgi:signal transduction histidine kinase
LRELPASRARRGTKGTFLGKWRASPTDTEGVTRGGSRRARRPSGEVQDRIEHELKTALTVARGYLRMLADGRAGELAAAQQELLTEARRQVERFAALLDELRALRSAPARPRAHKPARLQRVIESAAAAVRPAFEERSIALELALDADVPPAPLDVENVERLAINLLLNAAKFSPRGSKVHVSLDLLEASDGPRALLSVADQGPGVAAHEIEAIFDPYFRGSASADAPGVGLGLAICREIAAAHGGSIEAVPSAEGGLFRVTFGLEQ